MKISHITDLHLDFTGSFNKQVEDIMLNKNSNDILCLLGDICEI